MMINSIKYGFLFAGISLLLGLTSCQENEHIDYTLNDRIYFYETDVLFSQTRVLNEKNYSFALKPSSLMEDTVKIAVRVMGRTSDRPRVFRAVAVADSTTAQSPMHYELLTGTIAPGAYEGYLPVLIKRTPDTQDHSVTLYLQMVDSEDFTVGNPDALNFKLSWGDMLLRPAHWPYYFGVYSTNKYRFAIDILGITDWQQADRFSNGSEPGVYTAAQLQLFAAQLNEAYQEYRKTHGPIYVDDDAEEKVEIYYSPTT